MGDSDIQETGYSSKFKPQLHYNSHYSMLQINSLIILPCVKLPTTPDKFKSQPPAIYFSIPKVQEQIFPGSAGTFLSQPCTGKEIKTINSERRLGGEGCVEREGG